MNKLKELLKKKGINIDKDFIREHSTLILKIFAVSIVAVIFTFNFFKKDSEEALKITDEKSASESGEVTEKEVKEDIIVDISGEVKNPMVVQLPSESRIDDAIAAAGGLTENADITNVNRAEILQDGQKILIPSKSAGGTAGSTDTTLPSVEKKVNINTATSEELRTLDGVGPATAEKIIFHREENGRFKKIDDLKDVSGIGEKTFEKLKDNICV